MTNEALLIGMGQLGAVFAGFLGIILALVQKDRKLDPGDALRTRSILHPAFLVILGSTLPLILGANDVEPALNWQISAIASLAAGIGLTVLNIRFHRSMTPEERQAAGPLQTALGWVLTLPGYVFTALVAAGYGGGGFYIAALGSALLVASWNFITLAGKRWL